MRSPNEAWAKSLRLPKFMRRHADERGSAAEKETLQGVEYETIGRPRSTWSSPRYTNWHALAVMTIFTLISIIVVYIQPWHHHLPAPKPHMSNEDGKQWFTCGETAEEAIAAGCKFDVMSFTWSHPKCFDKELMDDFLSLSNWTWSLDGEGKELVPLKDLSAGQHDELYVSWEYHVVHCTYMWRKMHRAILKGKPLDSYVGNMLHTEHCEKMLLDRTHGMEDRATQILLKFPRCPL